MHFLRSPFTLFKVSFPRCQCTTTLSLAPSMERPIHKVTALRNLRTRGNIIASRSSLNGVVISSFCSCHKNIKGARNKQAGYVLHTEMLDEGRKDGRKKILTCGWVSCGGSGGCGRGRVQASEDGRGGQRLGDAAGDAVRNGRGGCGGVGGGRGVLRVDAAVAPVGGARCASSCAGAAGAAHRAGGPGVPAPASVSARHQRGGAPVGPSSSVCAGDRRETVN